MSGEGVCRLRGSLIFWLVCHAVFLQAFLHGLSRPRPPLLGIGALMDRLKRPFALWLGLSSISWSEASGCTVHEVLCQITPMGITVGLLQNQACQGKRLQKKRPSSHFWVVWNSRTHHGIPEVRKNVFKNHNFEANQMTEMLGNCCYRVSLHYILMINCDCWLRVTGAALRRIILMRIIKE